MSAAEWADQQVAAVRDDPLGRLALMQRCYCGPYGRAPRHLPFRRAATAAMRWELARGVLLPGGSPWWRAVNEQILRDGCEAVALTGDLPGTPSSRAVGFWQSFAQYPTSRAWWRAHNASVVTAYATYRELAAEETLAERFFMNVVLCRVLYTHALAAAPRIALSWLAPIGPLLGDPRLGMAGIFLQLARVLPDDYPLAEDPHFYIRQELTLGRLLDYGLIVPRLRQLYDWSAAELGVPELTQWAEPNALSYAMTATEWRMWEPQSRALVRLVRRALPAGF
ncbi:hypothetical protein [Kribbella sp. NPDC051770]|uniref:hypothetical protein n=1 Tax=Kribbella sp. NPDC051770 TaxID=3155413 RepID=UPI00342B56F0